MSNSIKSGFLWTAIEKFSVQFVQFVLGIIIARYITPSEYGILGVLLVFINISQVFIESGLGSALIYRNNLDDDDLQTTFSFNLVVSIVIVVTILVFANQIESILSLEGLSTYLSFAILVLIINAFILVPTTILQIRMNFKAIAITNFFSALISGSIGVFMAISGYGVWALVVQLLAKSLVQSIFVNFQCKWLPKFRFLWGSFRNMYQYAFAIFGTSCITKFTGEGISLFIAKILTPYSLGIFTRANQFASLTGTSLGSIFSTVLFPAFSKARGSEDGFNNIYNKMMVYQAVIIIPLFFMIAVLSKPLILILLTEKWIDVVPVLQILCVGRIFSTISIATEQAICASGRSDLEFKQQVYKLILKILCVIVGFSWGILGIALADAISTLCSYFITNFFASKCKGFSIVGQFWELFPFVIASLVSSVLTYLVLQNINNMYAQLIFGLILFVVIYLGVIYMNNKEILENIKGIILKSNN